MAPFSPGVEGAGEFRGWRGGGFGRRMRSTFMGASPTPKWGVPLWRRVHGKRTLTIDRALQLVRSDHLITVIQADHRPYLEEAIGGPPPGLLLEQPRDCGSAVSVLFSLAHIPERDPEATVIVLPADQFVYPEERWVRIIAVALHLA